MFFKPIDYFMSHVQLNSLLLETSFIFLFLYGLLTTGEILMEEGGDIAGILIVYREMGRRVYGDVFNFHQKMMKLSKRK